MKKLPIPVVDAVEVYSACISGVSSHGLAKRLAAATDLVQILAHQYTARANTRELHKFPSAAWGNDDQVIFGDLTKGELTDLYTNEMVKRTQPGRPYYDRLMLMAPLGKCPFCGFGHVSTLDHYLSKARYPSFSVLPVNLVPSCTDCNKSKGAEILDGANDISHPYFEDSRIETSSWLYATINETKPATATFLIVAPVDWPIDLTKRVGKYVNDLQLPRRFAIEASSELASMSDYLGTLQVSHQIDFHLQHMAQLERNNRKNSWKAALYEAASESAWYREGGYRRPA